VQHVRCQLQATSRIEHRLVGHVDDDVCGGLGQQRDQNLCGGGDVNARHPPGRHTDVDGGAVLLDLLRAAQEQRGDRIDVVAAQIVQCCGDDRRVVLPIDQNDGPSQVRLRW
jgi:hypothetical protein